MAQCRVCGERLRRIHRTLWERFLYVGIFECQRCKTIRTVPRRYTFYLSPAPRCPRCGTFQLRRLAQRDPVDKFHHHPWTMLQRILGGKLYHCRYCRVQFYDRRRRDSSNGRSLS